MTSVKDQIHYMNDMIPKFLEAWPMSDQDVQYLTRIVRDIVKLNRYVPRETGYLIRDFARKVNLS
jgi:hypothetical protein